jgi:hypothetical protein
MLQMGCYKNVRKGAEHLPLPRNLKHQISPSYLSEEDILVVIFGAKLKRNTNLRGFKVVIFGHVFPNFI